MYMLYRRGKKSFRKRIMELVFVVIWPLHELNNNRLRNEMKIAIWKMFFSVKMYFSPTLFYL